MDKRSLLIGLGIGIIIGALLMQLFLVGEQASKHGEGLDNMINGSNLNNQGLSDTLPSGNNAANLFGTEETSSTPSPTPSLQHEATLNNDDLIEERETEISAPKTYIHRVQRGATITDAAATLYEHDIITDIDSFIAYVRTQTKLIRAGFFMVTQQSSDEYVFSILTSDPLTENEANKISSQEQIEMIFSP